MKHSAFSQYQQQLLSLIDAPEDLLREFLRVISHCRSSTKKRRLLESCPSTTQLTTTDPFQPPATPSTDKHKLARSPLLTAALGSPSTITMHPFLESSTPPASLTTGKSKRNAASAASARGPSRKLYHCGGPRCQNKMYKRLGAFQNHMNLIHQLTSFDPSAYLFNQEDPADQQRLKDHQLSTTLISIPGPRPSVSSGSTAWSGSSRNTSTSYYAASTQEPGPNANYQSLMAYTDDSAQQDAVRAQDNSPYAQFRHPSTPFTYESDSRYRPSMPPDIAWPPLDYGQARTPSSSMCETGVTFGHVQSYNQSLSEKF